MNFKIIEENGKKYRVFPKGNRLPVRERRYNHFPHSAGVYMVTVISTGRKYIGSTSNLNKRAGNHVGRCKTKSRLLSWEPSDIEIEILEEMPLSTESEIKLKELFYIESLNTTFPHGLNTKCPVTNKKIAISFKQVH